MSLFGAMFSGVTGLNGQSRSMSSISDNIANVNTTGYKASRTDFQTLVAGGSATGSGGGAGVRALGRSLIDQQGLIELTDNATDIAVDGPGFIPVTDAQVGGTATGKSLYTRAGSFRTDAENNLVNASGFYLMAWPLDPNGNYVDTNMNPITPDPTSTDDLQLVNLSGLSSTAAASENITVNTTLPVARMGDAYETSVQVFDELGSSHQVSLGFTKIDNLKLTAGTLDTMDSPASETASVLDSAGNSRDVTLTYTMNAPQDWTLSVTSADGSVTGGTVPLTFDGAGNLTSDSVSEIRIDWTDQNNANDGIFRLDLTGLTEATGGTSAVAHAQNPTAADHRDWKLSVKPGHADDTVTAGTSTYVSFNADGTLASPESHTFTMDWDESKTFAPDSIIEIDLGRAGTSEGLSNRGDTFNVNNISADGLPFGNYSHVTIDGSGRVVANFDNGNTLPVYQIPLAVFNNPNALTALSGNAWQSNTESGNVMFNRPESGGAGALSSSSLEASTVDLATEFTKMIVTQRAFSANSSVVTTSDEMLEELVRIKR